MSITYTVITDNGQTDGAPVAVSLNYQDFLTLMNKARSDSAIPKEVYRAVKVEGLSPVKAWRQFKSVSQQQLANRLGVKAPTVSAFEKSGAKLLPQTKQKIAKALRLDVEVLFFSTGSAGLA